MLPAVPVQPGGVRPQGVLPTLSEGHRQRKRGEQPQGGGRRAGPSLTTGLGASWNASSSKGLPKSHEHPLPVLSWSSTMSYCSIQGACGAIPLMGEQAAAIGTRASCGVVRLSTFVITVSGPFCSISASPALSTPAGSEVAGSKPKLTQSPLGSSPNKRVLSCLARPPNSITGHT